VSTSWHTAEASQAGAQWRGSCSSPARSCVAMQTTVSADIEVLQPHMNASISVVPGAYKMPMQTSLQLRPGPLGKTSVDGILPLLFHPILRFLLGCRPGAVVSDSHNELSNRLSNQICRHGHATL